MGNMLIVESSQTFRCLMNDLTSSTHSQSAPLLNEIVDIFSFQVLHHQVQLIALFKAS